jgi:hypothetical protein
MHADAFVGIKTLATPAPTRQHPCMPSRPCLLVRRRAELRRMPPLGIVEQPGLGSAIRSTSPASQCETSAECVVVVSRERAAPRAARQQQHRVLHALHIPPCRVPPQQPPHAATKTMPPKEADEGAAPSLCDLLAPRGGMASQTRVAVVLPWQ